MIQINKLDCKVCQWRIVAVVRDRTAQCMARWREVGVLAWQGGDHMALVTITHEGIDRREVQDVLRYRRPDAVVKSLEHEASAVAMLTTLERAPRGVEPLRIMIMPQRFRRMTIAPTVEPFPVVVWCAAVLGTVGGAVNADRAIRGRAGRSCGSPLHWLSPAQW